MEGWQLVMIVLTGAGLVFTVVWNLAGRPTPLSATNLRRPVSFILRKRAEMEKAHRLELERLEQEARDRQHQEKRDEFFSACNRLRQMQEGTNQYHNTEWRRQKAVCKASALAMMRLRQVAFSASRRTHGPIILRDSSGTMLIDYGHDDSHPGQLGVSVDWHPCPSLRRDYIFEIERIGKPTNVFIEWLSEEEVREAGWEEHKAWIGS